MLSRESLRDVALPFNPNNPPIAVSVLRYLPFQETVDNCWTENSFGDCDDETQEWLNEFLEDHDVSDLESEGWEVSDTQTFITSDIAIRLA